MRRSRIVSLVTAVGLASGCTLLGNYPSFESLEDETSGDGDGDGDDDGDGDGNGGVGGMGGNGSGGSGGGSGGNGTGGEAPSGCVAEGTQMELGTDIDHGFPVAADQIFELAPSDDGVYYAYVLGMGGARMLVVGGVDQGGETAAPTATLAEFERVRLLSLHGVGGTSELTAYGVGMGRIRTASYVSAGGVVVGLDSESDIDVPPLGSNEMLDAVFDNEDPQLFAYLHGADGQAQLYTSALGYVAEIDSTFPAFICTAIRGWAMTICWSSSRSKARGSRTRP